MAPTINWLTRVITVPQADLTLLEGTRYEYDLNVFRKDLKDIEDDEEGAPFIDTHRHNTEVTIGGITYARFLEIVNGYTVTFEDLIYSVNLFGANSNVLDVANENQVSIRANNSAGLIVPASDALWDEERAGHAIPGTFGETNQRQKAFH